MKELEFIKQFSTDNKGILTKYGEIYILARYCEEFIKSAAKEEFAIIGIDGFYINKNCTRPNMNEVCDFSESIENDWNYCIKNRVKASMMFFNEMKKVGKSNYYCFTLLCYNEYLEIVRNHI